PHGHRAPLGERGARPPRGRVEKEEEPPAAARGDGGRGSARRGVHVPRGSPLRSRAGRGPRVERDRPARRMARGRVLGRTRAGRGRLRAPFPAPLPALRGSPSSPRRRGPVPSPPRRPRRSSRTRSSSSSPSASRSAFAGNDVVAPLAGSHAAVGIDGAVGRANGRPQQGAFAILARLAGRDRIALPIAG